MIVTIAVVLGCSNTNSTNQANSASTSNMREHEQQKDVPSKTSLFDVNQVCSLPAQVGAGTPYQNLSGRKWERSNIMEEEWDYGCKGNEFYSLSEDDKGDVTIEYDAIGGKNDIKYITIEYMAIRYAGLDRSEMSLREGYVGFLDKISRHYFGEALPKKTREQMLGRQSFDKKDTGTAIGPGYVNLSINYPTKMAVSIDVHFFDGKDSFEKYKNK